jgi:CheY-like chemotaxis protein
MSARLLNERRVLIVEDEFLVTVVREAAVQAAGASVVRLAASTADALALIEAESFLNLTIAAEMFHRRVPPHMIRVAF